MGPNLQFPMDLITFTKEISHEKLQNRAFATKNVIKPVSKFYFTMYKENIK